MLQLKPILTEEGRRQMRNGPPEEPSFLEKARDKVLKLAWDYTVRGLGSGDESLRPAYEQLKRGSLTAAFETCLSHPVGVATTWWYHGDVEHSL